MPPILYFTCCRVPDRLNARYVTTNNQGSVRRRYNIGWFHVRSETDKEVDFDVVVVVAVVVA
jgi:hypothetical protein